MPSPSGSVRLPSPLRVPGDFQLVLVVLAAAAGGAVNAIAGGGTLLTFPALIALGVPPLVANATSTVALWPGAVGSLWGYRGELAGARAWAVRFAVPSVLGGAAGAMLLLVTPAERFAALAPWLVLGATLLFMAHGPLVAAIRRRGASGGVATMRVPVGAAQAASHATADAPLAAPYLALQFATGVYGGYFGAGIGILMLATLGMMGLTNIHRMNGLKNWGGLCINVVAAITFAVSGLVNWPVALAMAVGAILGGLAGAHLAQRVAQQTVRRTVVVIGLLSTVWLLLAF